MRRRQGVNMNSFRAVVTGTALVFVLVLFVGPAVAADLCPPPTPPITDSDDRRMREENFRANAGYSADACLT